MAFSIRLNPPSSAASTAQPVDMDTNPSYAGLPKEMISIIFNLIYPNFWDYSKLPLVSKSFSALSTESYPLHQQVVTASERLGVYERDCINDGKFMKVAEKLKEIDPSRAWRFLEKVIDQLENSINKSTEEISKKSQKAYY